MARQNNVMIADGVRKEIACIFRRKLEHHLGAAEIVLVLVVQEFSFGQEMPLQITGDLEHRNRSLQQFPVDADTDTGFEITGGVLLAFGDYSTDTPNCASVSFTSDNWYGSDKAAFKPEYKGSTIFYGGDVKSVSQVNTSGMKEFKFPNGKVYMYK